MKLPKINRSTNTGGHRIKIEKLYLPPWTKDLPDHANISAKDMAEYNNLNSCTVRKYMPKVEKIQVMSWTHKNPYRYLWPLGLLRKHFEVGPE
jgi:hypothetical protein